MRRAASTKNCLAAAGETTDDVLVPGSSHQQTPRVGLTIPGGPASQQRLEVALASAPDLADLASLFSDLLVADMAAHHINAPEIQGPSFVYLRRACWEGAIIAYGRCFGSGRGFNGKSRLRLDDFLVDLPGDLRAAHEEILQLRNKRIGHHVAPHGGQEVRLFVGFERPQPTHVELTNLFVHIDTELYDCRLLEKLQVITTRLREELGTWIDALRLEQLKGMALDLTGLQAALRSGTPWSAGRGERH